MVYFQVSRVDHDRLGRGVRGSQPLHHANEDTPFTSPFPPVVKGLVGAILLERIAPAQSVPVDENDTDQHLPITNSGLAVAVREIWLEPRYLLVGQPVQVTRARPPHGA